MMRGAGILLVSGCLAAAGCAATHDLKVRPIADPAAKFRYGGDLLGQARAQLALGDVGLALETFRQLQREQPASADAFAGIAQCYAAMGRFDLERANYEIALASTPRDPVLLTAFAGSLDHLGERAQAAKVRAELAQMAAASGSAHPQVAEAAGPAEIPPEPQLPAVPSPVPHLSSITVELPHVRPVASNPEPTISKPASFAASVQPAGHAAAAPAAPAAIRQEPQLAAVPSPVPHLSSITVELPPVRPVTPNLEPVISRPAASPVFVQPDMHAMAAVAAPPISPPHAALVELQLAIMPQEPKRASQPARTVTTPHLERISRGEVALVTKPGPIWSAQLAAGSTANRSLRWLPIQTAEGRPVIHLLNAARTEGLAARSRTALVERGWRRVQIGDYHEVRRHSLVLYSAARAPAAQRLAAQFGCRAVKVRSPDVLIVLLGRDTAARKLVPRRA